MKKFIGLLAVLFVVGGVSLAPGTGFAASNATFHLNVTVVGNGAVSSNDGFIVDCTDFCTHNYSNAEVVTLSQQADAGWTFDHWNGSVCEGDTTPTCTVTMSNHRGITATFEPDAGGGDPHLFCAGDIGGSSNGKMLTSNRILALLTPGDRVCTLGDLAYGQGTTGQFNSRYDPSWGRFADVTYPAPGNHEYMTSGASGYFNYFNNNWAGSGAVPNYYRATVGDWDIYSLNSEISHSATSAQINWLEDELAANPTSCIMAYWHKPRWSSGEHGSDAGMQPFWNALAGNNVDLILNGHDHDYERFAPIQGMRQLVVGTGGVGLRNFVQPPETGSQVRIKNLGVLDLTLSATGYDASFINPDGVELDGIAGSC